MKLVKGIIQFILNIGKEEGDDIYFQTDEEAKFMRENLIISELRTDWRGKKYRTCTSLPQHNIYKEKFSWREYEVS